MGTKLAVVTQYAVFVSDATQFAEKRNIKPEDLCFVIAEGVSHGTVLQLVSRQEKREECVGLPTLAEMFIDMQKSRELMSTPSDQIVIIAGALSDMRGKTTAVLSTVKKLNLKNTRLHYFDVEPIEGTELPTRGRRRLCTIH